MGTEYVGNTFDVVIQNSITIQNTVNSVPSSTETDIISYTVPVGNFVLLKSSASGKTDGEFKLYINSVLKEVLHNAWTERNVYFIANESVNAGLEIKVTVLHTATIAHDFSATLTGVLL